MKVESLSHPSTEIDKAFGCSENMFDWGMIVLGIGLRVDEQVHSGNGTNLIPYCLERSKRGKGLIVGAQDEEVVAD